LFIKDIAASVDKILDYTRNMSRPEFFADSKTYDAVLRNLEIIGEATKNVPEEIRQKYGNGEWKKWAGLRDIAIHQYFGINEDILWDIVTNKIAAFKPKVAQILDEINAAGEAR